MTNVAPNLPPDPLLERVMETSLDAIVLCQAIRNQAGLITDFQVIRCNDRASAMTGIPRVTMLSVSMVTLDPDCFRSGIFDTYRQVVDTGLPACVIHHFAGPDIWMAQSLARFDDGVLGSWSDITALKEAEQARQQETELLQAILDHTQTGIAVMQSVRNECGQVIDFRFTHLNPDAERITQRRRGDLIGQQYSVAWPEARTNGVLGWHIRVAQTGEPAKINGVPITVGPYTGWYNIRIRPFNDGVIATFVDVTALKKAELATQQQTDLLRSVLDSSSNAIIAFSTVRDVMSGAVIDFRYVAHNEANRRNMNRSDEDILGHTMLEFFPDMRQMGLFDRFVEVVMSGEGVQFEQEFRAGGWQGWYELSARKWGDGIVLTLVDITGSKGNLQKMEQTNRDLRHANDNLRQFAHVASHDLQEPLRKILAFSDMLQLKFGEALSEEGHELIGRMQSAARRMSVLIKDVLAYSRISTHREVFQPVSLTEVMADLGQELQQQLVQHNARLQVDSLPTVWGDRSQLRQLFDNLLTNALKFRSADRQLVVHMNHQTVSGPQLPEGLDPEVTYYEISFSDNGIGFEERYADRIFQVFQRLHARHTYDGTGVGLAICKRVVENHRGAITALGKPDEGATFRIYLPQQQQPPSPQG